MKKLTLLFACLAFASANAKVDMPSFFSNGMVLQQQTNANIWGQAKVGSQVKITASWNNTSFTVQADNNGKWMTALPTPAAGGPYKLIIDDRDGEACVIDNVMIGEVWFCSGQSNMEMPVKGYGKQPAKGASEFIVRAKKSTPIRICNVARKSSITPVPTLDCKWQEHTPEAVAGTSATAYFFAEALQASIDVPVGIIVSSWGGSSIEAWMTRDVLENNFKGEFSYDHLADAEKANKRPHQFPCLLYNGQVSALVPFTIKGMIWYQGESNRGNSEQYTRLQTAYVKMMRELFQVPDAPFYFVQIAPYPYDSPESWQSGYFYEAQAATLKTIPHSGMAATVDAGEYGTIHPCRKMDVGRRLAYLALKNDYGMGFIEANPPLYKSMTVKDGKALITFDNVTNGLAPMGQDLTGFEVAGADKVFHPATGRVSNEGIEVKCAEVAEPVAVRYCFRNWCVGTVFNTFGVPVAPFRTDDWQL
ncbi:MAG: sialate O-acetylesterase [Bacteroidales bacterium]|nr:sialate O-acetylesterase [Bacteroidales bacterium]